MTRIALLQMTTGIDPAKNAEILVDAVRSSSAQGAQMLFTPEMCGLLDSDRSRSAAHVVPEREDPVLKAVIETAQDVGMWVALGSLAVEREDGRWANRSFLLTPDGSIAARYDKIHMFDVELATGESWKESAAYVPGEEVVTARTPVGKLGLAVCYDVRFPALFEEFGRRQCDAIAIPAAFTVPTGEAHWHLLQRARAIESSAFVISAAQVGEHEDGRRTYGHSLVVGPWGDVLLDMGGEEPGLGVVEIDLEKAAEVRRQLPSLANKRNIPTS